jgi:hypothetical protein
MPPGPPRRRPSSAVVDRVEPGAVREYRQPSFGDRDTTPPPHEDGPPLTRHRAAPFERRPRPTNPPPDEYVSPVSFPPPPPMPRPRQSSQHESEPPPRRSRVDIDAEFLSEAEATRSFHSGQRVSIPIAVIIAIITSGGGALASYFATRGAAATPNCATKDDVTSIDRKVETLNNGFTALTEKVNQVEDRTHNDLSMVNLKLDVLTKQK